MVPYERQDGYVEKQEKDPGEVLQSHSNSRYGSENCIPTQKDLSTRIHASEMKLL